MTGTTISIRVDAAERSELAIRAERDKVSLSDYIRVRLGLRGEGPQNGDADVTTDIDDGTLQAQLADHHRRLEALETGRPAATGA